MYQIIWRYMFLFIQQDPFLLMSKVVEDGVQIPICKTEVIKNDLNPIRTSVNIQQVGSKVYNLNIVMSFGVAIYLIMLMFNFLAITLLYCQIQFSLLVKSILSFLFQRFLQIAGSAIELLCVLNVNPVHENKP